MTLQRKIDPDIQQDVLRELAWDTRVSPREVGVLVKDGGVTLVGTVESWAVAHGVVTLEGAVPHSRGREKASHER